MKVKLKIFLAVVVSFYALASQANDVTSEPVKIPEIIQEKPLNDEAGKAAIATDEYKIVIKDHKFSPDTITVPAGKKIKLKVDNQDATPEEFESHDLHREKIIPGGKSAIIAIGPLKKGEYKFFGEFNEKTAQGVVKAE